MNWRNHEVGRYYPSGFVAGLMFFMAFALVRFSPVHTVLATALASIAFLVVDQFVVGRDTSWLEALFVIASFIGFGVVIGVANRRVREMFVDVRRRENLQRFLPRQVADRVMKNSGMLAPSQREVTVLFTDIRDFTSMSERMAPNEVLAFLDRYFGHMSQIVKGHDGIVNKFLGDGMLAVWGAPDSDDLHAEKALKAALDMRRKLKEFNEERAKEGIPPIRMGIGIHTGIVAAGMLGGADQHEYTVIGDAVNLASRIEGLTKSFGVDLLVSESTFRQLREKFDCARAGEEKVKGRSEPVVVFTVA
jgi:adenylate cyclase